MCSGKVKLGSKDLSSLSEAYHSAIRAIPALTLSEATSGY